MSRTAPPSLRRWIADAAWSHKGGLTMLCLILLAQSLVQAAVPWPMKTLIDNVLQSRPAPDILQQLLAWLPGAESTTGLIAWIVAATVAIFAAATLLSMAHAVLAITVGQRMVYATAAELFAKLQRLSLAFHARRSVGDSMKRITTDCAAIASIIRDAALPAFAAATSIIVMVSIMLALNPLLTLTACAVIPPLIYIVRHQAPPVIDRGYAYAESEARVWNIAERTLSAVPVIQAFSAERRADSEIRRTYDNVYTDAVALMWAQFRLKISGGLAMAVGTAAILLVGTHEVLAERLTLGGLWVFMAYLAALYAPLDAMVFAAGSATEAAGGARRVIALLAEQSEVPETPGASPLSLDGAPSIALERVCFAYEPQRCALDQVSLEIPAGATFALVGASGAGKTTLAGLIPRLHDPQSGRVLLGGRDVREFTLRSLREHIAILAQDTYLFPVSIAENIAYARADATPDQIRAAAQAAGAHEFIERLPSGYDTIVGQRGATLSVGERQRVAIARAFLKDAPVLILDEPTSALDAASESHLLDSLDRLRRGRTTIIIAHRLSTVRHADVIVVLDGGRVVETGAHDQLIALGGHYARMHAPHPHPPRENQP